MSIWSRVTALFNTPSREAFADLHPTIGTGRAFDAGRRDIPSMVGWRPRRGQVDREALVSRDQIVARARDLVRNNPIISGGVDRRSEAVVGARIRMRAQPDFEAMGRDFEWADKWARGVEAQFRVWDRDSRKLCDAERSQNFGAMVNTAYRHWWVDGEALAYIEMRDRGSAYQTCIRLIDPDRLANPEGKTDNTVLPNGNKVVGGVEIDPDGVAVAYHIRVEHPDAQSTRVGAHLTERVEREDWDGRPRVVHAFKRNRAEQRRGISRLVASMKRTKMLDRYDDAELEAALLNAVMAAKVKTNVPTAEIKEALAPVAGEDDHDGWNVAAQLDYRERKPLMIDGVQIANLLPNEDLEFVTAERPAAHYPQFRAEGLRSIASDFGLSHQQLAQNWEDINYSSARTLLNEIWRGLLDDRWLFTQEFCTPIGAAWLQEAVAIRKVKVPGGPGNFYRYRAELTMFEWMGPGRGRIDPKKEADASDMNLAAHRTNLAIEAAEQGLDAREVMMGAARDRKMREEFGLPEPKPAATVADADDDPDAADIADRREREGQPA